jgi:hypothetical protein
MVEWGTAYSPESTFLSSSGYVTCFCPIPSPPIEFSGCTPFPHIRRGRFACHDLTWRTTADPVRQFRGLLIEVLDGYSRKGMRTRRPVEEHRTKNDRMRQGCLPPTPKPHSLASPITFSFPGSPTPFVFSDKRWRKRSGMVSRRRTSRIFYSSSV